MFNEPFATKLEPFFTFLKDNMIPLPKRTPEWESLHDQVRVCLENLHNILLNFTNSAEQRDNFMQHTSDMIIVLRKYLLALQKIDKKPEVIDFFKRHLNNVIKDDFQLLEMCFNTVCSPDCQDNSEWLTKQAEYCAHACLPQSPLVHSFMSFGKQYGLGSNAVDEIPTPPTYLPLVR